jgi:Fur family ferric uptake transcriptional regulator
MKVKNIFIENLYIKMKIKLPCSRATLLYYKLLLTVLWFANISLVKTKLITKIIFRQTARSYYHDDTGEVIEFCDPRIQTIKSTIEEIFDIEITNHALYFYGEKVPKSDSDI